MQRSQLRLGDTLDDYCPRERRVTNHAVVAMVGGDVKQTRCTTCDSEHEYKHARVPRPRKKPDLSAALPPNPPAPKHVGIGGSADPERPSAGEAPESASAASGGEEGVGVPGEGVDRVPVVTAEAIREDEVIEGSDEVARDDLEEGPVHRRLIRATLPRLEGQDPPPRQAPDFTIRQPTGRVNRFRTRQHRGPQASQGNRNGNSGGGQNSWGSPRQPSGRQHAARSGKRQGPGRKRSK